MKKGVKALRSIVGSAINAYGLGVQILACAAVVGGQIISEVGSKIAGTSKEES